jgi:hypothetical protein
LGNAGPQLHEPARLSRRAVTGAESGSPVLAAAP